MFVVEINGQICKFASALEAGQALGSLANTGRTRNTTGKAAAKALANPIKRRGRRRKAPVT